ncbi:MAG: zf-HC2 domain-containing protein, partial [Anaerolineae bacterium]|nr:zf-HC2 domain-containing protein [Anaerolineae bacterium]
MQKHLDEYLAAYLDGELDIEDMRLVNAHLLECEYCRAKLDQLQELQHDMTATFDAALSPETLTYAADGRIREVLRKQLDRGPAWWQVLWQRRGLVGQAIMAVMALLLSVTTLQVLVPSVDLPVHVTTVISQDSFAPGSRGALRVVVQSLGSVLPSALPVAGAEVVVSLKDTTGTVQKLYEGETDRYGSADITFAVPDSVEGSVELIVDTTSTAGSEKIIRPIRIQRSHKIYLGSDKPAYRPGQTLYLRALVLDAVTGRGVGHEDLAFEILAGTRRLYMESVALSEYGVAVSEFVLPAGLPPGPLKLRAQIGVTTVERQVEINPFPLPSFNLVIDTSESYLLPGDQIHGSVTSAYFFNKPVQGSVRVMLATADDSIMDEMAGDLDRSGMFDFIFDVPESYTLPELYLIVTVQDIAGQIEGLSTILPVSEVPVLVKAIPESGKLVPGVENAIYIATTYPDGQPAHTELIITAGNQQTNLTTDNYGLAVFHFIPGAALDLNVYAQDGYGNSVDTEIPLEMDSADSPLLLRTEKAVYNVGDTLLVEALTGFDDAQMVYLDVIHASQTSAVLSSAVQNGRAAFALDLDNTLTGALTLRAYVMENGQVRAEDSRAVVVDPVGILDIEVSADQNSYKPGETARLSINTALRAGDNVTNVQSVLGLGVVDSSVLMLDRLPPGFARTYYLLENTLLEQRGTMQGFDPPALLEGDAEVRQAQDVVARAAWAGVETTQYPAPSSIQVVGPDLQAQKRDDLIRILTWFLMGLPLAMVVVVVRGLQPSGVLVRASGRLVFALLALTVLSPLLLVGVFVQYMLPWLGGALTIGLLLMLVFMLSALIVQSWAHHDSRLQLCMAMLVLYVITCTIVIVLLAMPASASLHGVLLISMAVMFLLLLTSLYMLGQGLVLEGRRVDGWLLTGLVVILILLAVSLPALEKLNSEFSQTLGSPMLYTGPLGWMSGCSAGIPDTEVPSAT